MKAFDVCYSGPGYNRFNLVVLVEHEDEIEVEVAEKSTRRYDLGTAYCKIEGYQEISLSKVKLSDLSVSEFMRLTGK